ILNAKLKSGFDSLDYRNIECEDENVFRRFVEQEDDFVGFNVTFPYKYIASELDGLRLQPVEAIHSANTIFHGEPNRIASTDGAGFRASLEKLLPTLEASRYALTIIGAGGASRAVMQAMYDLGWKKVAVVARSMEEARRSLALIPGVKVLSFPELKRDE